jgi:hypothetical protein
VRLLIHGNTAECQPAAINSGVYTIDAVCRLASSGMTPGRFLRSLNDAMKGEFAVERDEISHLVFIVKRKSNSGSSSDIISEKLIKSLQSHLHHQACKVDSCYALLSRMALYPAAENFIYHELIQKYFDYGVDKENSDLVGYNGMLVKRLCNDDPKLELRIFARQVCAGVDNDNDVRMHADYRYVRDDVLCIISSCELSKPAQNKPKQSSVLTPSPTTISKILQGIPSHCFITKDWSKHHLWAKHSGLPFEILVKMVSSVIHEK